LMYQKNMTPQRPKMDVVPPPVKKPMMPEVDEKVLNKLYEEYADIGRPISRSMKHKLLSSPSNSSSNHSPDGASESRNGQLLEISNIGNKTETISPQNASSNLDEIPTKKPKLSHCSNDSNQTECDSNDVTL